MNRIIHKELYESGRWFKLSLIQQLANVGSDVERTIKWKNAGDLISSQQAFERALELIDFIVLDPKNKGRLREVLRVREFFADYIVGDNHYGFTDEAWQKYFRWFGFAAARERGR